MMMQLCDNCGQLQCIMMVKIFLRDTVAKMFRAGGATFFGRWGSKKKSCLGVKSFLGDLPKNENCFGVCDKFFGCGVANKFGRWQIFLHATRDEESPK